MARTPVLGTALSIAFLVFAGMMPAAVAAAAPLNDALDCPNLVFTTSGDQIWSPATGPSPNGTGDFALSIPMPSRGHASLSTSVTGPGVLSFYWSTQAGSLDTLFFRVDGGQAGALSGTTSWSLVTQPIGAGAHPIVWDFVANTFMGNGMGVLDGVAFNTQPTLAWAGGSGYTADGLEPQIAPASQTFVYRVKYTDPDGGLPAGGAPLLHIRDAGVDVAGSPFRMTLLSGETTTGAIFTYSKAGLLVDHSYSYWFEAGDTGGLAATGPPTSFTTGPTMDHPPTLVWAGTTGYTVDGVEPDSGAPATSFTYRVKYTDVDGDAPAAGFPKVKVWKNSASVDVPGSPFTMTYVSGTYASGATYELSVGGLAAHGDYAHRFDAQDIYGGTAGLPAGSSMNRGPIVNTAPVLVWDGNAGYTTDGVEPNTGVTSDTYVFRVKYTDADGDAPGVAEPGQDVWLHIRKGSVEIADSPFQMTVGAFTGQAYCTFSKSGLTAGEYSYRFEATDRARSYEGLFGAPATGAPTGWTAGPSVNAANNAPRLDWTGEAGFIATGCSPPTGTPSTSFAFHVRYADQDGDAPALGSPRVHIRKGGVEIAGSPFAMDWVLGTPLTGSVYAFTKAGLDWGTDYTYAFDAVDARGGSATGLPTNWSAGPTLELPNHAPDLTWTGEDGFIVDGCSPGTGTPSTVFAFHATYSDQDGDEPLGGFVKVHIKKAGAEIAGSPLSMELASGDPKSGAVYRVTKSGLAQGADYTYAFEAQDLHGAYAGGSATAWLAGPEVAGPSGDVATSITIRTAATSASIGKTVSLSGTVTPVGMVGRNICVYVKKPGRAYWTYSSNRTAYALGGGAAWLYKYYFKRGMAKGYYAFKAVAPAPGFPSSVGYATSTSPTTVGIRLR
jgi:hypothetical protein